MRNKEVFTPMVVVGYLVFAVFVLWVGLRWHVFFVKWCVAQ